MHPLPLIALLAMACNPDEPPTGALAGTAGGHPFSPSIVVFDEVGPALGDTATPAERQVQVVLADSAGVCPLLGPLYHLLWLRCASACEGLLTEQELWPERALGVVWIGITAGESATGFYELAMNDAPGVFTARYRAADLDRLAGLDVDACLAACAEDHDFLWSAADEGQWGELELETWGEEEVAGSLDLLQSTGDLAGTFVASPCGMGLY